MGVPRFDPLLASLDERAAVVFIHPTSPPCWQAVSPDRPRPMLEFPFDTTRAVTDLLLRGTLERYPNIRFVVPHCGGALPLLADRIELFRTTFMSTQDQPSTRDLLSRLWYDLAGTPYPAQAPALIDLVGTDHLLYGSDYCFTPPPAVARQIASLDTATNPKPELGWRALTARNAGQLLTPQHQKR